MIERIITLGLECEFGGVLVATVAPSFNEKKHEANNGHVCVVNECKNRDKLLIRGSRN